MSIERRPFTIGPDEYAHLDFTARLRRRLSESPGARVCDIGGGARPALELEFLAEHDLQCLVVDISQAELDKAPGEYSKLCGDISSPSFDLGGNEAGYDVVFSRVLAEHVSDPATFHRNVHRLLKPGGVAMHFFPTLYWPPFVVNRLLPEAAAEAVLLKLQPWRQKAGKAGKFPAYYRWCRGPIAPQVKRFESVGFEVEHCVAYFGEPTHAPGNFLKKVDREWSQLMVRFPVYWLTTYCTYTLRAR